MKTKEALEGIRLMAAIAQTPEPSPQMKKLSEMFAGDILDRQYRWEDLTKIYRELTAGQPPIVITKGRCEHGPCPIEETIP